MQKKYNFNIPALGLDGQPLKDGNNNEVILGSGLSLSIAQHIKGDAIKLYNWALMLFRGEELALDPSDLETLTELVMSFEMSALIKAQILIILKN